MIFVLLLISPFISWWSLISVVLQKKLAIRKGSGWELEWITLVTFFIQDSTAELHPNCPVLCVCQRVIFVCSPIKVSVIKFSECYYLQRCLHRRTRHGRKGLSGSERQCKRPWAGTMRLFVEITVATWPLREFQSAGLTPALLPAIPLSPSRGLGWGCYFPLAETT